MADLRVYLHRTDLYTGFSRKINKIKILIFPVDPPEQAKSPQSTGKSACIYFGQTEPSSMGQEKVAEAGCWWRMLRVLLGKWCHHQRLLLQPSAKWKEWPGPSAACRGGKATKVLEEFPRAERSFNSPGLKSGG